jgi:hypothetical protein
MTRKTAVFYHPLFMELYEKYPTVGDLSEDQRHSMGAI